ncbi:MAG: FAD-dependent oxidoreductase [Thermoactinospora sp.]|nr:FAD-dependent oxidoreductase [Thermoactinospora sp.]
MGDKRESYWMDTAPATSYPPPAGDLDADVAVVGGGIAGLSTAWELSRAGRSVVVLEADRVAAGVTGYTTAKLSALHGLIYAELSRSAGEQAAALYAASQQEAVEHVAATAAEFAIDCDLERLPAYTYTESADAVGDIEAEATAARAAGLEATLVTGTGLPYGVAAAVRVENQAQFHPRKYLLGLTELMAAQGVVIHERTRVTELHEGSPCRLVTEDGHTVTARDVVVATHYPVFDRALLFARLEPRRELVVAGPIPAGSDPGGMFLTVEDDTRSVRTAPYRDSERFLIVTGERHEPGSRDAHERHRRLRAWAQDRFPGLHVTHAWSAQDNQSTDRMPYIGRFHVGSEHVYVATGFNGWGMSTGVLSGRLLAAELTGHDSPYRDLYDPRRLHPLREAASMAKLQLKVARHFVGDRLRTHADDVDDIGPDSGAVVRVGGERRAVYRDPSGQLHQLSALCTHLGCVVAFDENEKAWECPCHGSRFGTDGQVLNGPATSPLPRRD